MDEFAEKFRQIDEEQVRIFLRHQTKPCFESTLWKIAFKGKNISGLRPLDLYQSHFLLFHLLFLLQDKFHKEGKYLHIHFMQILLTDYPHQDQCRHFSDQFLSFCKEPCAPSSLCCQFHKERSSGLDLEELSNRYFYLDKKNYYLLNEQSAEDFVNGSWEILTKFKEFYQSLAVLDLPANADLALIKKKFKTLAKLYHPDLNKETEAKFIEINNAYQLLLRFFLFPRPIKKIAK